MSQLFTPTRFPNGVESGSKTSLLPVVTYNVETGDFINSVTDAIISNVQLISDFTTNIQFTNNSNMGVHYITGPLLFTPNIVNPVIGVESSVLLISNGTNVPIFSGFSSWISDFGFNNSQANLVNLVRFWYDGITYRYEISQPSVNTPI